MSEELLVTYYLAPGETIVKNDLSITNTTNQIKKIRLVIQKEIGK